jgi:cullin 1
VILKICDELDKARELHDYFKQKLTAHIKTVVLTSLDTKEGEVLLKYYIKEWKDYTILVHFIRKMFNYLDRYFLKNSNAVTLATTALNLFRDQCFIQVHERVRKAILNQMSRDRNSELVDLDLVKRAIYTFVEMGFISADIVK